MAATFFATFSAAAVTAARDVFELVGPSLRVVIRVACGKRRKTTRFPFGCMSAASRRGSG